MIYLAYQSTCSVVTATGLFLCGYKKARRSAGHFFRDSLVEIYFFDGFFFTSRVNLGSAVAIATGFINDITFIDAVADFAFVELYVISTISFFIDDVAAHVPELRQCQRLNFGFVQVLEIDLVSVHFLSCLFVFGSYCFRFGKISFSSIW